MKPNLLLILTLNYLKLDLLQWRLSTCFYTRTHLLWTVDLGIAWKVMNDSDEGEERGVRGWEDGGQQMGLRGWWFREEGVLEERE